MRVIIATTHVPFTYGGAEAHAESLRDALRLRGHDVELMMLPFRWYPPEKIHEHLLACRLLDVTESNGVPVDRVIGLKFPAYHIRHPNKVLWVLHQYRSAFEMWGSRFCDLSVHEDGREVRDSISRIERNLLPEARHIYANSQTVAQRMKTYCQYDAEPLYHPPQNADKFHCLEGEDFLYCPSRINHLKRQYLVIEALAESKTNVRVVFSGAPDNPKYLEELKKKAQSLKVSKQITWLGRIPFDTMADMYARARGILFVPEQEDYGYITLEALLSRKPVITCTDSGGPLEFIRHGQEGLIATPEAASLGKAMDEMWKNRQWAREAGQKGHQRYHDLNISWDNVVSKLLD